MATYTERQAGSKLADSISEHAQVLSIAMFFVLCVLFFVTGTQWLSTPDGTVATEQGLLWETLIVVSNLVLAIATWCCYERERAATTGQPTSLPSTV